MGTKSKIKELHVRIYKKRFYRNSWGIYEVELLGMKDTSYNEELIEKSKNFVQRDWGELTIIVGAFDREFFKNEEYIVYGEEEYNEKYKSQQWKIISVKNPLNSPNQVKSFIMTCTSSEKIANQLVKKYGDSLINDFCEDRIDYTDIDGLGPGLYGTIRERVLRKPLYERCYCRISTI